MAKQSPDPRFSLVPMDEMHLDRAPLEKVLTQIVFSRHPVLNSDEGEERLAALLPMYPIRRQIPVMNLNLLQPLQQLNQGASISRTFEDSAQEWKVTVLDTSIALETNLYSDRDDFCRRIREILDAVSQVSSPPVVDRVGLRYIDRISEEADLKRLREFVNPQMRVLLGSVEDPLGVEYSMSDTVLRISEDERMKIRSGLFPPNIGHDPVLPPLPVASWVLDVDVFTVSGGLSFVPQDLEAQVRIFAEHAYSFFRWATSDTFQTAFQSTADDPLKLQR